MVPTATAPAVPSTGIPRSERSGNLAVGVLLAFVGASVILFRHGWAHPGSTLYGGGDGILFTWFVRWTEHAAAHGTNPFLTGDLNAPAGVNMMWNTGVPLLGIVVAPITAIAGPVVALNVLVTLAPALSAWVLFLVLRRWTTGLGAAVGGLLYGFGPYMIGASSGHLHLAFAVFPPLLLLLLDDLLVRQRHVTRTGVLLGIAVTGQALISEEVLATSAIVAACGVGILALQHRDEVAGHARGALRGMATAVAVAVALLAWPLATQFLGPQQVHGLIQQPDIAVSDALTFVVPTHLQAIAPAALGHVSKHFTGNPVEVSGYLGIPLVIVVLIIGIRHRKEPVIAVSAPLLLVTMVLSLGPHLHIDGHNTGIPLPWRLIAAAPLMGSILPSRLALYSTLLVGVMLAIALGRIQPHVRPAAAVAIAVALVPLFPAQLPSGRVDIPAFFANATMHSPYRGTVLVVPYPNPQHPEAMLWQAAAGIPFRLPGCYCLNPAPDGQRSFYGAPNPLNKAIIRLEAGSQDVTGALRSPGLAAALSHLHPTAVILGPSRHRAALRTFFVQLFHAQPVEVGGVDIWPQSSPAT